MQQTIRPLLQIAILGISIRCLLLYYGYWQDKNLQVKYTDVDYWVFSDAAIAMKNGLSPFIRSTYRYTPALAAMLIPVTATITLTKFAHNVQRHPFRK